MKIVAEWPPALREGRISPAVIKTPLRGSTISLSSRRIAPRVWFVPEISMIRTFMIRHGKPRSTWGEDAADPDPGLDETGKAQAEAAADALMALPADVRPSRVFASPLRRCRETAEPFAHRIGAEVVIDPRLGEIPTPKALSHEERGPWLQAAFELAWSEIQGDQDYDAWRRSVAAAVVEHAGAALFSHFVAINGATSCALESDAVMQFRPDQASITIFGVEDGRLTLVERGREADTQVN
jgi:broad specificity phosphatase PhoE